MNRGVGGHGPCNHSGHAALEHAEDRARGRGAVSGDGMESRLTVLRCTTLGLAGRLLLGLAGVAAYLVYLGA